MINNLEFIISPSIERSRHDMMPLSRTAILTARKVLWASGLRRPHLALRTTDDNEREHLEAASESPYFDVVRYFEDQLKDKKRYRLEHISALTLVYAPLYIDETRFRATGATVVGSSFGYTNRYFGESVVSTYEILEMHKQPPLTELQKVNAVAYTVAHEAGHLFGLVSPRSSRATAGDHCQRDECLMATTASTTETVGKISKHGLRFCGMCALVLGRA